VVRQLLPDDLAAGGHAVGERERIADHLGHVQVPVRVDPPPEVKVVAGEVLASFSEKMPNWKGGIATVWSDRPTLTSPPEIVCAVVALV
jgi:hypothetical protein